jgi:hypothetical protein
MATWTPDPTFYPSAKMAMEAPREDLAYVAILNTNGSNRPDAPALNARSPVGTMSGMDTAPG